VHAHAASQASFARKSLLLWLAPCAGCQTIFHLDGGGFRQFATVRSGLLKKGLAQLVELSGWLEPAAREQQLNSAAVFCLPSHAEGLPMALLEAMAAGKAVVASRVGGIPEAVHDGENGLLVPPRDARALATALARVLADAGLRARRGERTRDTVAQHYSTEAICGRLAAIHNDLAGAR
jgi:glycosyltransferase involved in cell wall biosynthesis